MKLLLWTLIVILGTVKCAEKWPWEDETNGNCWMKYYDGYNFQGNGKTTHISSVEYEMNINSIKVKPGCCVIVYQSRESTGNKRWRICYDFENLGDWAGKIKSWRIEQRESSRNCKATLYNHKGTTEDVYKSKNIDWNYGEGVSSIKITKGCCATIFPYRITSWVHRYYTPVLLRKRFCEDLKTLPAVFNDKVKSIRMEQRPFPSCRVEVFPNSNFGGVRTVYSSSVAQAVPSITSYRISKGCNAVFFDKPGYNGNQKPEIYGQFIDLDKDHSSNSWNNRIKSLIISQDDEPACKFLMKGEGTNHKSVLYYKNEPFYNKDIDMIFVPAGCYVTLFNRKNYGGISMRIGHKRYGRVVTRTFKRLLGIVESFIIDQV